MTSFNPSGHGALQRASRLGLAALSDAETAQAFEFLLSGFSEQRRAIRALDERVKRLEAAQSGDARYQEHAARHAGKSSEAATAQDRDDPAALEVW